VLSAGLIIALRFINHASTTPIACSDLQSGSDNARPRPPDKIEHLAPQRGDIRAGMSSSLHSVKRKSGQDCFRVDRESSFIAPMHGGAGDFIQLSGTIIG